MTVRCHFDGKVFVPDEPVELPVGHEAYATASSPTGVTIVPAREGEGTVGDLLRSGAIGGWKHRTDITDGRQFVDEMRAKRRQRRAQD